ncbi:pyrethroid hydrolase Ces2a-like [Cylas formicarius]|uniref:pyrethroid hydrolase Ces2a-like n=1 Tax=Cylas formicarius TaxID=197179 RepID=UPI002958917E|nr:pyrethroid hydrolase Ces2a-like [Cylas formicarius]
MHIILLIGLLFISIVSSDILVDLPDGTIRGTETNVGNSTMYAYLGIPFAAPPLGKLRFQAPVQNDPWDGILDATKSRSCCLPMGLVFQSSTQNEDCLYLNIYTPPRNVKKLPVMFWIYGGGFVMGCATDSEFNPIHLVNEDVIVVTSNYRLGLFGFLSTNDSVILGNAGLKDQLLALKWTQQNIALFGGDPDKVTIFGESAGGVSVGAHIANKKSAGLYRAAICQSGCSLASFPDSYQSDPKQVAYDIAKSLNSSISQDSEEIRDFLQSQSVTVLALAFFANPQTGLVTEVEDENAYNTELHFGSIESGNFNQVPVIIGTNSAETIILAFSTLEIEMLAFAFDVLSTLVLPSNLKYLPGTNLVDVSNLIKQAYTNQSFALDLASFIEFTSDTLFVRSSLKQAELQSNYSTVYFYQFSYSGSGSSFHIKVEGTGTVGHAEELFYIFEAPIYPLTTDEELLTRRRMVRLWTNFAKTLNPTSDKSDPLLNVTWPQVSGSNIPYLDIGATLEVKPGKKEKQMAMWNEVFYAYGEQPFAGPVIEVEDDDAYITDRQFGLIESGNFNQIPLLIGTTSGESLTFYGSV